MKCQFQIMVNQPSSRSREGAWIEIHSLTAACKPCICRSREGAWIEIAPSFSAASSINVAPARERGLKLQQNQPLRRYGKRRSREGAWIEIYKRLKELRHSLVAPARERGLKYLFN